MRLLDCMRGIRDLFKLEIIFKYEKIKISYHLYDDNVILDFIFMFYKIVVKKS